ncbi:molybdopterin-dependent oxidoreductase [Nonomuraea wenchangensis]
MGGSQVNQALVRLYFEVRDGLHDPVAAWAKLTGNSQQYAGTRGERRVPLDDGTAAEIAAAAIVHTAAEHGRERVAALATSPLAALVGGLGGAVLTEHPCAPEQVLGGRFGGAPRAEEWARAAYVLLWGENNRLARTADTPWVIAGRYKGQKVVAIGTHPTRLSDETLVVRPGTDGALAMAMGHVLLKEFFLDRTPFDAHAAEFTDLPFLVRLREREGAYVPGEATGQVCDRLSLYDREGPGEAVEVLLPRFDDGPGVLRRGVPVLRDGDELLTTVFDLLLAGYGVVRPGLPGRWPDGYGDRAEPYTPAWQEACTGVPASRAVKIARELGVTAEKTDGRCVIVPGRLDTPHADTAYRAMLALLVLTGCGGGWAQVGTAGIPLVPYLCLHACGEDRSDVGALSWALAEGLFARRTSRSVLLEAVRDGWPMAPPPRVLALPRPIYPLPPDVDLLIGPDDHCDLAPPGPELVGAAVARLGGRPSAAGPAGRAADGRMRLLVDHAWMREYGEALPVYRPPGLGVPLKPTQLVRNRR